MGNEIVPRCKRCLKNPEQIPEYTAMVRDEAAMAAEEGKPPPFANAWDYVRREEGTYNPETGKFWCTECYIKVGMPLGTA
jgi:hypothetical protein